MHSKLTGLMKDAGFSGRSRTNPLEPLLNVASTTPADSGITKAVEEVAHQIQQLTTMGVRSGTSTGTSVESLSQNVTAQGATTGGIADSLSKAGGGFLGGLLGIIPILSGITNLFGGGQSQPEPLVKYRAPLSQNFDLATSASGLTDAVYDANGQPRASSITEMALSGLQKDGSNSIPPSTAAPAGNPPSGGAVSPQITVQVQAMDSQSFMDRSQDIALAVRHAMLNMNSINDVVNDI